MFWPCETRTSICRNLATISSGLYRFLAITVLLDVKDIPQVGPLQWGRISNFSGVPGETDLLLRNSNTGGLEVYNIANHQLTGAAFIGTVGLDWQFAGIAPVHAAGASDLILRNVNTGQFEVYDIAGNTLVGAASLGTVGLDWQLGGFAVDPPTVSGTFTDISDDQL